MHDYTNVINSYKIRKYQTDTCNFKSCGINMIQSYALEIEHFIIGFKLKVFELIKSYSLNQLGAKYNNLLFKDSIITVILNEFQLYLA